MRKNLNCKVMFFFLSFSFSIQPSMSFAKIRSVKFSLDHEIKPSRWMFGGQVPKASPQRELALAKRAFKEERYKDCLSEIEKIKGKAKIIEPWVVQTELRCAQRRIGNSTNASDLLSLRLKAVENHPEWLLVGPYSESLKKIYVGAKLVLLESDLRENRSRAWGAIDDLLKKISWFSNEERARFFELGGKLAFAEQKGDIAEAFFRRSLQEVDSRELRERLKSLRIAVEPQTSTQVRSVPVGNEEFEASRAERDLVTRMNVSLRAGDFVAVVEDGVKLLLDFPGGRRAQWAADRMKEVLLTVVSRNSEEYEFIQSRMLLQMEKVDADRLYDWAKVLYQRGYYKKSLYLAQKALPKFGTTPRSTAPLKLISQAAHCLGEWGIAVESNNIIVDKHAGTPEAVESLFDLGVIQLRRGEYSAATSYFEKLLVTPQSEKWEYPTLYWLYRSLDKMKSDRKQEYMERLLKRYPLTYYGLRALADKGGGKITMQFSTIAKSQREWVQWMSDEEFRSWERFLMLVEAGWFEESREEIRSLSFPQSDVGKLFLAKIWGVAFAYPETLRLSNEVWDRSIDFSKSEYLKIGFPREFDQLIDKYAKSRNLVPNSIRAVIRQESSYQIDAISPMGALGLMQILPSTAKEIAQNLSQKTFSNEQLYDPDVNIRFGNYYLSQLLKKYENHFGIALAAYNSGIGRMNRWIDECSNRKELMTRESESTVGFSDLWMDEIPWSETSFYVKAVLRNWILYELLEKGQIELPVALWARNHE